MRHLHRPSSSCSSATATAAASALGLPPAFSGPPAPPALLAHLQAHAGDYQLWPLHEVDRDDAGLPQGGGVVGAVSLSTWRPLDPARRGGQRSDEGEGEMLVFVMTLADGDGEGDGNSGHGEEEAAAGGGGGGGGGDFRVLIMHRKGKERGQRGSYMEIPGRVTRLLAKMLEAAAFDLAKARIWARVQSCLAEKRAAPSPTAASAAAPSPTTDGGGVPLAAPMPLPASRAHGGGSARTGPGLARAVAPSSTAQEDISALPLPLPLSLGPPHAPFRALELAALLHFSSATPLAAMDAELAPLFGNGDGAGEGEEGEQQQQLEGLPWLAVLAHLERGFWRRAVVVEGLRVCPGEADLLLSCHGEEGEGEGEGEEAAGTAPGRRPTAAAAAAAAAAAYGGGNSGGSSGALPRVLLHLSTRPRRQQRQHHGDEVDALSPASTASDRRQPYFRAQLLVRTGGERSHELTAGERRQVEVFIGSVLGFLWLRVLGQGTERELAVPIGLLG